MFMNTVRPLTSSRRPQFVFVVCNAVLAASLAASAVFAAAASARAQETKEKSPAAAKPAAEKSLAEKPAEAKWRYSPESFAPFWAGRRVTGESVLFIKDEATGESRGTVFYPIENIEAIRSSAGDFTYEQGRDYVWKKGSREIVLPKGSRIVARTPQDLRRPPKSQKYQLTHRDGNGEIFFGGRLEYHEMQTAVTYTHEPDQWQGPVAKFDAVALPRTVAALKAKQPLSMVLLGDSISTGCNASGWADGAPFQPPYQDLLQLHLEARFQTKVELTNLSVGGTDTAWGLAQVEKVVAVKPQLVLLAFGMNDSAGRSAADYQANIAKIMAAIRAARPECEFILIAPMLGNRDWIRLKHELFPEYRDSLAKLREPGVALADLTAVWDELLKVKKDWDLTGNGVNHPNDFGHRLYAQVLAALLVGE